MKLSFEERKGRMKDLKERCGLNLRTSSQRAGRIWHMMRYVFAFGDGGVSRLGLEEIGAVRSSWFGLEVSVLQGEGGGQPAWQGVTPRALQTHAWGRANGGSSSVRETLLFG